MLNHLAKHQPDRLEGWQPLEACPLLAINEQFLAGPEANRYVHELLSSHHWPDNRYQVFGRQLTLPRQQTWHADPGIVYSYSNNLLQSQPWTPLLSQLRQQVEAATGTPFNAVLVNHYRNGEDHVDWHSDDEAEMGEAPLIASLSLGATRHFEFRRTAIQSQLPGTSSVAQGSVVLAPGSLLVMRPPFQQHWQHRVPPCDIATPRINLTFRYVYAPPKRSTAG